jgi:hypothetical protein
MMRVAICCRRRLGTDVRQVSFPLAAGYGAEPAKAHQLVALALTAASHPVVVDAEGYLHRVPRKRLLSFAVWEITGRNRQA